MMKLQHRQASASSTTNRVMQLQAISDDQLNDELLMKVEELEKLFAVYKLRVHGEPNLVMSGSSDEEIENVQTQTYRGGKSYERYKQIRDAKLREEWTTNRFYKESVMEALRDSLERARAEMHHLFPSSAATATAHPHHSHPPPMETKQQQTGGKYFQDDQEEEEEAIGSSFSEQLPFDQDNYYNQAHRGGSSSSSTNWNKPLPSRSLSFSKTRLSTTTAPEEDVQEPSAHLQFCRNRSYNNARPEGSSASIINSRKLISSRSTSSSSRNSAAPIPRPTSAKTSSTSSRRTSPPPSADFRKENTKPSNGSSNLINTFTQQPRSHARSKSTCEEMKNVIAADHQETPMRTTSLRRFAELKEPNSNNNNNLSSESKPLLRKGNGIGPGAGAGLAKKKNFSVASDQILENGDESSSSHNDDEQGPLWRQGSRRRSGSNPQPEDIGDDIHESSSFYTSDDHSPAAHPLNQMRQADANRARKRWGSTENPFSVSNASCQSPKDANAIKGFNRLLSLGRKVRVTY